MRLLAAVVVLIVYGSLYPFDFGAPANVAASVRTLFTTFTIWTSRGDVLGNVGLFIPYGIVGMFARPAYSTRARVIFTIAGGLAIALLIQVAQIWVVSRSAVMADVLWNAVGLTMGIVAALALGSAPARISVAIAPAGLVSLSLLTLWLLSELAPLVPSLDLVGIRRSLRFLRSPPAVDPVEAFYVAARVILAGRLIATVVTPKRSFLVLAAAVIAVIGGKALVVGLTLNWTTLAGLLSGALVWRVLSHGGKMPNPWLIVGVVSAAYTAHALAPFNLRSADGFSWIPFATVLEGGMLNNLRALASATFLIGGTIWLMSSQSTLVATVVVAAAALLLEVAQIWIDGRTAGTTEGAAAVITGWALSQARSIRVVPPS
jgi:VanZ family protein